MKTNLGRKRWAGWSTLDGMDWDGGDLEEMYGRWNSLCRLQCLRVEKTRGAQ